MRKRYPMVALATFAFGLSGCDPGIHLAWRTEIEGTVDQKCIADALKGVAEKVTRETYVSDGWTFPKGTSVDQIWYQMPFKEEEPYSYGGFRIEIAALPMGHTGLNHEWGKIGTHIEPEVRASVAPVMHRVNALIKSRCNISLGVGEPVEGDG